MRTTTSTSAASTPPAPVPWQKPETPYSHFLDQGGIRTSKLGKVPKTVLPAKVATWRAVWRLSESSEGRRLGRLGAARAGIRGDVEGR